MISSALATMSDDLRRAASRRAYADVQQLVAPFCEAVAEEARSLPAGDPRFRELGAWLDKQLEATRILLKIGRAAHAGELRRIPFLRKYLRQQTPPAAHLRLDL